MRFVVVHGFCSGLPSTGETSLLRPIVPRSALRKSRTKNAVFAVFAGENRLRAEFQLIWVTKSRRDPGPELF